MRVIDIHAHLTPQCFWKATENGGNWHGITREIDSRGHHMAVVAGRPGGLPPRARWDPEERIVEMDSLGVDVHVVSPYSGFYNYHLDTSIAQATCHDYNNEISDMARNWPDRFAGLGSLPMQDIPATIRELERCMGPLGLKGAMINDHVNGRTLDEPEFLPFWKAAEETGALIFFHQGGGTTVSQRADRYHLPNTIGNLPTVPSPSPPSSSAASWTPAPTSRFASPTAAATPATASAAWTAAGRSAPKPAPTSPALPAPTSTASTTTASSTPSPPSAFLIDSVGVERVIFGTDWPYDMVFDWPVSWILSLESITQEEKELILYKNLERLLGI